MMPVLCAVLAAASLNFGWSVDHGRDGGGTYRLEPLSEERFVLNGMRTDSSCKVARALVSRRVDREMWTQNVMMFSVRSTSGRLIRVIPEICWRSGSNKTPKRARAAKLAFADALWHNVSLALGADFGLPDAGVTLESMALQLDIENWSPGQSGGIEVRNVRACAPGEVSFAGAGEETFTIIPGNAAARARRKREDAAARAGNDGMETGPLRVFFAFDNNDVTPVLRTGKRFSRKDPLVWDAPQDGGFREELLRDLDGAATVVTNLSAADAIVYSRCRPDPALAAAIAAAVKDRGVPLYAASEIADPEIAALLPCELTAKPTEGWPERARIAGLSDATFGVYRGCRAKADATTLYAFENGVPAVVEGTAGGGRVLYTMTAIGQTLVPGKRAYDAFFVRMLGRLTGRALPEEEGNLFAPDRDGWYAGVGRDDFGRFGWTYASGLLVESLGGSLRVVKGDGEYAFRPVGKVDVAARARRKQGSGADAKRAFTFAPSGVSSLAMGGDIAVDGVPFARFDGSLAYPGTRWELKTAAARLELFGLATHAALPLADGVRVFDAKDAALPPPAVWAAPWMLLFRADVPCEPMLVTFGRKLTVLKPIAEDGALAGYELGSETGTVGMIGVTWPWGDVKTDASGWVRNGPDADARARVALWYPRSFAYPVRLDEKFRRSADGTRFEIVDRFSYRETADEWQTPRRTFAAVPPYAYYMSEVQTSARGRAGNECGASARGCAGNECGASARGCAGNECGASARGCTGNVCGAPSRHSPKNGRDALFASPDALTVRLFARTGPFADVEGDTVRWSLPVPEPDLSLLPHTRGFETYDAIANETFRKGVRFSSGGGTTFEAVNKAYPGQAKKVPEILNWNMHGALLGVCRMMPNPYGLDAANRAAYARRIAVRLLEPLETHPYKMTTRWRIDPMSGARYTIYMNSPRDLPMAYAPESFGSKFVYGDSNETIRMIAAALQMAADRHGQYGAAKANAETLFRHVASYAFKLDDWLNMSAGCIEFGGSYAIDMLNTEYGGQCSFARLAEICGDRDAREHFLFRAARRAVPTLARLTVTDALKRAGVLPDDGEYVDFASGTGEAGPKACARNPKTVKDLVLYDMSQGVCTDLVALYDRYAGDELRRRYFPQVRAATPANGLDWVICAILALGDDLPRTELEKRLALCAADTNRHVRLCKDWPGIQTSSYLEYVYAAMAGTPKISDCRDVNLHDAAYDPATGELTLDFTPGAEAALAVTPKGGGPVRIDVSRPGERRKVSFGGKRTEN